MERPAGGGNPVAGDVNEASRHIGLDGYLEAVQRAGEAISNGFDVGLFSCPTPEERLLALAWRQRKKFGGLLRTEIAASDLFHIGNWPQVFEVEAQRAAYRHRDGCHSLRMRQVEVKLRGF